MRGGSAEGALRPTGNGNRGVGSISPATKCQHAPKRAPLVGRMITRTSIQHEISWQLPARARVFHGVRLAARDLAVVVEVARVAQVHVGLLGLGARRAPVRVGILCARTRNKFGGVIRSAARKVAIRSTLRLCRANVRHLKAASGIQRCTQTMHAPSRNSSAIITAVLRARTAPPPVSGCQSCAWRATASSDGFASFLAPVDDILCCMVGQGGK